MVHYRYHFSAFKVLDESVHIMYTLLSFVLNAMLYSLTVKG